MSAKQRLSASVDADLIAAAERAVASGRAPTVSAWVNEAMRLKVEHDGRLDALAAFIADYEAEHGEITDKDMAHALRDAKRKATTVRRLRAGESPRRYGR